MKSEEATRPFIDCDDEYNEISDEDDDDVFNDVYH